MSAARESLGASAEHVAQNEAAFRSVNEELLSKAASWQMDGFLPALCECADTSCSELLRITPREYEAVRSDPRWFLHAPGHAANAQGSARVVAENDRFLVVEKLGEADEIVEQLDPRTTAKRKDRRDRT